MTFDDIEVGSLVTFTITGCAVPPEERGKQATGRAVAKSVWRVSERRCEDYWVVDHISGVQLVEPMAMALEEVQAFVTSSNFVSVAPVG